jgi:septal ring factor EnvC (AmiA/AmiB activator)
MASAGAENCHSIAADVTSQHAQSVPDSPANASDAWLRAQASDLIRHLQDWSEALDGREASLNARIALHERRERQFRIQRSELTQQLAEGQARVDQLRRQLEARVRRLAFEQHS